MLSGEGNPNYSYSEIDQMEKTFSILNIYRYSSWRSPAMGETWPGNIKLDQLRIYNRSLSTNEIINLYQKGIGN